MKNIFSEEISNEVINRIEALDSETKPLWGTMDVAKMLAHCNVTYEMVYTDKHSKPNTFVRFILKMLVKNTVVSDKPFSKNGKTAPQFIMKTDKNFDSEKTRLIEYINKTQKLGAEYFDGKESHSFGKLTKDEWNNSFVKHLEHHLNQFGV